MSALSRLFAVPQEFAKPLPRRPSPPLRDAQPSPAPAAAQPFPGFAPAAGKALPRTVTAPAAVFRHDSCMSAISNASSYYDWDNDAAVADLDLSDFSDLLRDDLTEVFGTGEPYSAFDAGSNGGGTVSNGSVAGSSLMELLGLEGSPNKRRKL